MSEGYDPDYDRDEYLAIEREERDGPPDPVRWTVRGQLKVRLVQDTVDGDDDVDTLIWIVIPWTGVEATPENPDGVYGELLDAVSGQTDALLGRVFDEDDVEDENLYWAVDE